MRWAVLVGHFSRLSPGQHVLLEALCHRPLHAHCAILKGVPFGDRIRYSPQNKTAAEVAQCLAAAWCGQPGKQGSSAGIP